MSALVIARRELAEKRFVFLTAAIVALQPFWVILMPSAFGRQSILATVGGVLAIGFTGGLAVVLGVSTIGRDLADKRLSFYFAKPVSAQAIWYGKLAAALLMIAGSFAIIIGPVLLWGMGAWRA